MELTLQANKSNIFIKNYENSCFYIADSVYQHNILILNNQISKYKIASISHLKLNDIEKIITKELEIIIIGTGLHYTLPNKDIINICHGKNIGVEFMKTESACKTFNLLVSEGRQVAGIFFA